jgi:hypothetical protein
MSARPLFLENPRSRWSCTPRVYQSPAEYASPIHHQPSAHGYSRLWWASILFCGLVGLLLVAVT